MPLIGPLLDAAAGIPNDLRDPDGDLGALLKILSQLDAAMRGEVLS
jgi:hypothetical protein